MTNFTSKPSKPTQFQTDWTDLVNDRVNELKTISGHENLTDSEIQSLLGCGPRLLQDILRAIRPQYQ